MSPPTRCSASIWDSTPRTTVRKLYTPARVRYFTAVAVSAPPRCFPRTTARCCATSSIQMAALCGALLLRWRCRCRDAAAVR